jgi:hypothetical protein
LAVQLLLKNFENNKKTGGPVNGKGIAPAAAGTLGPNVFALPPRPCPDRLTIRREERALVTSGSPLYTAYGVPPLFKPQESLDACGYHVCLYRSVLTLSMEIPRVLEDPEEGAEVQVRRATPETLRSGGASPGRGYIR